MWDVDRRFAWLSDRIICNSEAIRQRFRGSRAWNRTVTILNAVDTNEFNPQVPRETFRRELDIAPQTSVVGIVGRIGLGKGHDHFIEAAIRLLHDGSEAHFLVIGDTMFPEDAWRMEQLSRRVAAAGQERRIRFLGLRKDIPQVMRGLDILVLASDAEPCGRVLFEGMASETAIVATNTGGTPEIVRDGKEGILVPPCDPAALARAISRLIQDAPLRQVLGRSGLARVDQEFTVERYVAKTIEVYESVTRTPLIPAQV
jgi:glycosyltransferase involved in cell wall biosynthesis